MRLSLGRCWVYWLENICREARCGPAFGAHDRVQMGHYVIGQVEDQRSRGNADEHRPDPPMLDPRQNEAGEARGKHDPGSKPQRRIQKPFRGPAPHEDEEGTDCVHQRDYDTTDQPLPDWTGPSQCHNGCLDPARFHSSSMLAVLTLEERGTLTFAGVPSL